VNGYSFESIMGITTADPSEYGAFRLYSKVDSKIKERILKGYSDNKEHFERHVDDFIQRNFLCLAGICKTNESLTNVQVNDDALDHIFSFLSLDDVSRITF
jgi:hypothetical protein